MKQAETSGSKKLTCSERKKQIDYSIEEPRGKKMSSNTIRNEQKRQTHKKKSHT